jgi:hypothetical protein
VVELEVRGDLLVDVDRVVEVKVTGGIGVEETVAEVIVDVGVVLGVAAGVLGAGAGSNMASTQ